MTARDREHAKEMYSGKMLRETLAERLQTTDFSAISEIDLADLAISHISCFNHAPSFHGLASLDLRKNRLRCADGVLPLRQLRSLRLGGNQIEQLFSADARLEDGHFTAMTELWLNGNMVKSMDALFLRVFPVLRALDLSDNEVKEV